MARTLGARPVMRAEIAAAIRLRDRHCLTWREVGRILNRDHSTIRKAVARRFLSRPLIPNIPGMRSCRATNDWSLY